MTTPAAGAHAAATSNPYGLAGALHQGGLITWAVFIVLVIMSLATWYIMFTKLFEQQKVLNQYKRVRTNFWGTPTLRDGANKLERNSALPSDRRRRPARAGPAHQADRPGRPA